MESLAVICVAPEKLITEAKSCDGIQGYCEKMRTQLSSIYTSAPQWLSDCAKLEHIIIILYLPKDADAEYVRNTKKMIGIFGKKTYFHLITEDKRLREYADLNIHAKNPDISLSAHFSSIAKMSAKLRMIAA